VYDFNASNTRSVNIGLHNNVHSSNSIELDFLILVVSPVTHSRHVFTSGVVFLVTYSTLDSTLHLSLSNRTFYNNSILGKF
jgi:hypothetical protein